MFIPRWRSCVARSSERQAAGVQLGVQLRDRLVAVGECCVELLLATFDLTQSFLYRILILEDLRSLRGQFYCVNASSASEVHLSNLSSQSRRCAAKCCHRLRSVRNHCFGVPVGLGC